MARLFKDLVPENLHPLNVEEEVDPREVAAWTPTRPPRVEV